MKRTLGSSLTLLAVASLAAVGLANSAWGWSSADVMPAAEIRGEQTLLDSPQGAALGPDGLVYVANTASNSITAYPSGVQWSGPPVRVLAGDKTQIIKPRDLLFDQEGRLLVLNADSVTVYSSEGLSGNVAPISVLRGANTGLVDPRSFAVDSVGMLHIVNSYERRDGAGTVTVFPVNWTGMDIRPVRSLIGPSTGLDYPYGIAFDDQGWMYITNRSSVTVYPVGWLPGDSAPAVSMLGPDSELSRPLGVTFDDSQFMYLTGAGGLGSAKIAVYAPGWARGQTGWPSSNLSRILSRGLPPIATVTGRNTTLNRPNHLHFDESGSTYVANEGSDGIAAFSLRLQVISMESATWAEHREGNLSLSARSSSGLPVIVQSLTPSVCDVNQIPSLSVAIKDVGLCLIEASQEGDMDWPRAPTVSRPIMIAPSVQTVALAPVGSRKLSSRRVLLQGSASSGLPLVWTSATPEVCVTRGPFGQRAVLRATGTCLVVGRQPGNRHWNPADGTISFRVGK